MVNSAKSENQCSCAKPGLQDGANNASDANDANDANNVKGAVAVTSNSGLNLPHERDESLNATAATPDPVMVQAKRDIDAGLVDTDIRATPGLDAKLRAKLVPGAGGKPPGSAAG